MRGGWPKTPVIFPTSLTGGQVRKMTGGQVRKMTGGQVRKMTGGQVRKMTGGQVRKMTGGQVRKMIGGQRASANALTGSPPIPLKTHEISTRAKTHSASLAALSVEVTDAEFARAPEASPASTSDSAALASDAAPGGAASTSRRLAAASSSSVAQRSTRPRR